jgi:hypothetical protein
MSPSIATTLPKPFCFSVGMLTTERTSWRVLRPNR